MSSARRIKAPELVRVLRMTMRLLDEKRTRSPRERFMDRINKLKHIADEEQSLGIEYGPVERAYEKTLHIAGCGVGFLDAWERGHGLEPIPRSLYPNVLLSRCNYYEAVCQTQTDDRDPLCPDCWRYFETFFTTGETPSKDPCYFTPTRTAFIMNERQSGSGVCSRCYAQSDDRMCGLCAACQQIKAAFQARHPDPQALTLAEMFPLEAKQEGKPFRTGQ